MDSTTKDAPQGNPELSPLDKAKLSGAPLVADEDQPSRDDREGRDLIAAAADEGKTLSDTEKMSATDWFLTDEPADEQELIHTFELNVGSATNERWVSWTIRAVDMDTLRRIRRQASGSRAARRSGGEFDEIAANLKVVVEGTVDPNLHEIGQRKNATPEAVLTHRFRHKPGLLGQISAEIMSLSGYDDEDVREVRAGKG